MLTSMVDHWVAWGMQVQNVIVLLNHSGFIIEEKLAHFEATYRAKESIPQILRGPDTFVLRTCFVNPDDLVESVRTTDVERVNASRTALLSKLLQSQDVTPFNPRAVMAAEEETWRRKVDANLPAAQRPRPPSATVDPVQPSAVVRTAGQSLASRCCPHRCGDSGHWSREGRQEVAEVVVVVTGCHPPVP